MVRSPHMAKVEPLTEQQTAQRRSILTAALMNLRTVMDQLESLDNPHDDPILESLDHVRTELETNLEKVS